MSDAAIIHGRIPSHLTWWPAFGLSSLFALAVYGGLYFSLQSLMRTDAKVEQYMIMGCVALALADWVVLAQVLRVRARNHNSCGRIELHREHLDIRGPQNLWRAAAPWAEVQANFKILPAMFQNKSPDDDSRAGRAYAELILGGESCLLVAEDFSASSVKFAKTSWAVITKAPNGKQAIQLAPADLATLIGHLAAARRRVD